jgi:hypothetical protein
MFSMNATQEAMGFLAGADAVATGAEDPGSA